MPICFPTSGGTRLIFSQFLHFKRAYWHLSSMTDQFIAQEKRESSMISRTISLGVRAGILTLSFLISPLAAAQNSAPTPHNRGNQHATTSARRPAAGPRIAAGAPGAPAPATSPSSPSQEPSLSDLGFSPQQTQGDPKLQAELNKRTEMLKIHQRLGLITLAPMAATLITGPMAKAKGRNGQTIISPPTPTSTFTPLSAA